MGSPALGVQVVGRLGYKGNHSTWDGRFLEQIGRDFATLYYGKKLGIMLSRLTRGCVTLMQRYLPDAFLFAVILTFITLLCGVVSLGVSPLRMVGFWGDGAWSLLAFSMQMALVLVCGHTLASSKFVAKGLHRLSAICATPESAIVLVTFVSALACWINWGFGLVVGALLARALARSVKGVDYRLLIASAYSGFLFWHGGLSGSIPLTLASRDVDLSLMTAGVVQSPIPVQATLFSTLNLVISAVLLVSLPLLNRMMQPPEGQRVCISQQQLESFKRDERQLESSLPATTPAERLERSSIVVWLIFLLGLTYIVLYFVKSGFDLNLNIVILIFLMFGILLHGRCDRFLKAFGNAVKGSAGIILQFPFYAGIMGMMVGVNESGQSLAGEMSEFFVSISTARTFPLFTFLSAGLVNIFVPSGGGQWAVQGPIMMPAALTLGVSPAKVALAISWGDAWTNMIQPFWALPALGVAGLGARDIMGFCLVDLLYSGIVICLAMLLL